MSERNAAEARHAAMVRRLGRVLPAHAIHGWFFGSRGLKDGRRYIRGERGENHSSNESLGFRPVIHAD